MGKQQYTEEFKIAAVKRVVKTSEPARKIAAELGVKHTTLRGWISKYKNVFDTFPSSNLESNNENLKRLEKEVKYLKEENEILKKAAAYFARNQK